MKEFDYSAERVKEVVGRLKGLDEEIWDSIYQELAEDEDMFPEWLIELDEIRTRFRYGEEGTRLELRAREIPETGWLWNLLVQRGVIAIVAKVPWGKGGGTLDVYRRVR